METHLTFDNRGKQLGILVKERLTTDQNLQLKVTVSLRCSVHFDDADNTGVVFTGSIYYDNRCMINFCATKDVQESLR